MILGLKRVDFDYLTAFTSITIFVMVKNIYIILIYSYGIRMI